MSLGSWWYAHYNNNRYTRMTAYKNTVHKCDSKGDYCWNDAPIGNSKWGSAELFSDLQNVNSEFSMNCEYG